MLKRTSEMRFTLRDFGGKHIRFPLGVLRWIGCSQTAVDPRLEAVDLAVVDRSDEVRRVDILLILLAQLLRELLSYIGL